MPAHCKVKHAGNGSVDKNAILDISLTGSAIHSVQLTRLVCFVANQSYSWIRRPTGKEQVHNRQYAFRALLGWHQWQMPLFAIVEK